MADNFYFRIRGEVKGPFPREQIVALIRKKRLGRHHEISADAVNWQRAGDIDGLFDAPVSEETPVADVAAEQSQTRNNSGSEFMPEASITQHPSGVPASSGNSDDWFYAKGRNTHGPVSAKDLRAMLATGRVVGSDRIWNESLSDWVPVADVPQFMGSIVDSGAPSLRATDNRQYIPKAGFFDVFLGLAINSSLPKNAATKFPNLCRYLTIAEGVARILFILEILAAIGWFMFLVFISIRTEETPQILAAFFGGGLGLLFSVGFFWFIFIATLAFLELAKVLIRIEDNTTK